MKEHESDAAVEAARSMGEKLRREGGAGSLPFRVGHIENAALRRIDVEAADAMAELDQRFARERNRLINEADARRAATRVVPESPEPSEAEWPGWLAFTLAVFGPILLLAGEGEPSFALPGVALTAGALAVSAALVLLVHEAVRRRLGRRPRSTDVAAGLVAGVAAVAAGLIRWRSVGVDEASVGPLPWALLASGAALALAVAISARPGAREVRRARRADRDAVRAARAPSEEELTFVSRSFHEQARTVLAGLSDEQRDLLRRATLKGIDELEPRYVHGTGDARKGPQLSYRFGRKLRMSD
ncbi:hypothetical protein GCM10023169_33770 [Georgenia halophila]|uniref:DUF1707 domain-containing protein n=1 Tax=Georgenia halophila TaxID=620889 RepID=A0ABP8LKC7_9MICO